MRGVRWRRQRPLEVALAVLFVVAALVALVRAAALGVRLHALDDIDSAQFASRAHDADAFVAVMDVVIALVVVAIVPCFIVWCWRAAKNQRVLGRAPERLGPPWAIAGWFIPFANLVIPVLVMQDLWRGSDATIARDDPRWRIADRSWLVGWWWGLFAVALFTFVGSPADRRSFDADAVRGANLVGVLGMACAAVSAILAILVVRRLGERQERCRDAQEQAWPASDRGPRAGDVLTGERS
jgi:Domain of unknown function (DUF4328)